MAILRAQAEATAQFQSVAVSGEERLDARSDRYDQHIEAKTEGSSPPPEVIGETRVEGAGGRQLCVDIRMPQRGQVSGN